jgi:hypothetical protein
MQTTAKFIHRATPSYLPIAFPAVFYEIGFGNTGLEYVFAVHNEFKFDYEKEIIIPKGKLRFNTPIFAEQVDFPDSKINIVKICRGLNSYNEAINLLNTKEPEIYNLNEVVSNVN